MVKFTELMRALFDAHDDDDTVKLLLADACDDAAGGNEGDARFPAEFLRFRAEWLRHCVGVNRRVYYGISAPERAFIDIRFDMLRHALADGLAPAKTLGKWSGNSCRLERKGRFVVAQCRVEHPDPRKLNKTLGASVKFEFRRGLVYRIHVHDLAARVLAPVVLRAFPEATIRLTSAENGLKAYLPGRPLGEIGGPGSYANTAYGCYLDVSDVGSELMIEFERIVRALHWRDPNLSQYETVCGIKPNAQYPKRPDETYTTFPARNAALVALDAAATAIARRAAGIEHHFREWWNPVKHPAKLDGMNADAVASRKAALK